MQSARQSVSNHRRRQREKGVERVEIQVPKEDAILLRNVARVLADPARRDEARALLRQNFAPAPAKGLKALLQAAPLEDIDLTRRSDRGRAIDF